MNVQWLLDLLYPPRCPACEHPIPDPRFLCDSCTATLPPPPEALCLRCGADARIPMNGCGHCLNNPLALNALYCGYRYQGVLAELIRGFKFRDRSHWNTLLANLLWARLGDSLRWEQPTMVIPVPLHPWRLIQRRYNQAALLAGPLAKTIGTPLVTNGVRRIRMTPAQSRLDRAARMHNLRDAFVAKPTVVAGQAILLVDDVLTTGATLAAVAAALKAAGARRVVAACLAHTPLQP